MTYYLDHTIADFNPGETAFCIACYQNIQEDSISEVTQNVNIVIQNSTFFAHDLQDNQHRVQNCEKCIRDHTVSYIYICMFSEISKLNANAGGSRLAMAPTQSRIQWIPAVLSPQG